VPSQETKEVGGANGCSGKEEGGVKRGEAKTKTAHLHHYKRNDLLDIKFIKKTQGGVAPQ